MLYLKPLIRIWETWKSGFPLGVMQDIWVISSSKDAFRFWDFMSIWNVCKKLQYRNTAYVTIFFPQKAVKPTRIIIKIVVFPCLTSNGGSAWVGLVAIWTNMCLWLWYWKENINNFRNWIYHQRFLIFTLFFVLVKVSGQLTF